MARTGATVVFARRLLVAGALGAVTAAGPTVCAQTADLLSNASTPSDPTAVSYGPETTVRYRFGAKIVARGEVQRIQVLVAVPLECPEQAVSLVDEDISPLIDNVEYRQTDVGVRQMVISIARLAPQEEAHAYATFEVRTRTVLPPSETASLKVPKKLDRKLRPYVGSSPMIDVNHRKIRAAVNEALTSLDLGKGQRTTDWERVEALYDYALEHVAYQLGDDKASIDALGDGVGDCQAIAAVFVAMCRTNKTPARMVWVDGHQYAEFYLESSPGRGCWYPVESAGTRAFGHMPLARVILQKGDNIRVPERRGERLRYASDYAIFVARPTEQPDVAYVRERLQ